MKEFFVIVNKTSKSLSPLIFNHLFKKYKIDAKYKFVEVKKGSFEKALNKKNKCWQEVNLNLYKIAT